MHSFRWIADAFLLHAAQTPLLVLAAVCVLILAAAAVLVHRELKRSRPAQTPPEEPPCC